MFLGSYRPYTKSNPTQKDFLEDLILYIVKGYYHLLSSENPRLRHLVFFQCEWVKFPFQQQLMNEVFLHIVTKTKEKYHYYKSWFFKRFKLINLSFFINGHVHFD
jgi:hypothetical protein